ncbi:hypothetical protein ALQ52_04423, partial [Pseudomonas cannabina pv. alisalensis]
MLRSAFSGRVGTQRLGIAAPFSGETLRLASLGGEDSQHLLGTRLRQRPVGRKAQGRDGTVVAVPGDTHVTLDLADGIGNAQHQWLEVVHDGGAARRKKLVTANSHHRAIHGVFNRHLAGLDVVGQKACKTRAFDQFRLRHGTVDGLHRNLAQRMNILEYRLGVRRQFQSQHQQQQQQQCQPDGDTDPRRHELDQAITGEGQAAPVWRELTFMLAAGAADRCTGPLAKGFKFAATVVHHPIAALEAQAHAQVQKLQQVQPLARALQAVVEQLENLFTSPGFIVHRDQQALFAPFAGAAPRCTHDRFIKRGAKYVAPQQHIVASDPGRFGALLELAQPGQQLRPQAGRCRVGDGAAQTGQQGQQRTCGTFQRIEPLRLTGCQRRRW